MEDQAEAGGTQPGTDVQPPTDAPADATTDNRLDFAAYYREKVQQRRQIGVLLLLGLLLFVVILQIHHPLDLSVVSSLDDLELVGDRLVERALAPFTDPGAFHFSVDSLGWIIGATSTTLIALVFSGRNPVEIANESQFMALDELLELLTFLVGIAAAATMWMALHNVALLPSDPDSGPKFFLALLCLMLVIFSVLRQRDAGAQREIDEFHLVTERRLHTRRWERKWGVSARHRMAVAPGRFVRRAAWWAGCGAVLSLAALLAAGTLAPMTAVAAAVALAVVGAATAAVTGAAVSLFRSSPYPGAGLGYALVLLVLLILAVVSPFAAASAQDVRVFASLVGFYVWLLPSVLLMFRRPPRHQPFQSRALRLVSAAFDGARQCAYWTELRVESRRQGRFRRKLAALEGSGVGGPDA